MTPCLAGGGCEEPTGAPSQAEPRLFGLHILVVDDSSLQRELLDHALRKEGARCTLAEDGRQAVDQLKRAPEGFDAVLLDLQMPVLDGRAAARAIRRELGLAELPVVALTAGISRQERREAFDAGVDDVVLKPVHGRVLVETLVRWTRPVPSAPPPGRPRPSAPRFDEIPGLDLERILELAGEEGTYYFGLLGRLLAEFGDVAQQVEGALARGERESAARRLHLLRGNAGFLGAMGVTHAAGALEEALRGGRTDLGPLVGALDTRLAVLVGAARPWLPPDALLSQSAAETPEAPRPASAVPLPAKRC